MIFIRVMHQIYKCRSFCQAQILVAPGLALWAKVAASAQLHETFDHRAAIVTSFPFTAVHFEMLLKVAHLAVAIIEIVQCGAAVGNRNLQNFAHGLHQTLPIVQLQFARGSLRMNTRSKQRFVRVNIS